MLRYMLNHYLLNVFPDFIPHPKLRSGYFRLLGAEIGRNVRIEKVTFIQIQNSIKHLHCSDNSFIGSGVILDLSADIRLEECTIVAPGCSILTHQDFGEFNGNFMSEIYKTKYEGVHLANNVVIGADSTVLAGVNVGSYSVVAAKSLVTKDVPARVLVAGNPAMVVKEHGHLLSLDEELS